MRTLQVLPFFFLIITTSSFQILNAQVTDNVGSGRAIAFSGADDYIDLGNIFDDLALPVTISVWVNVDSDLSYAYPIFNSQDNLPLYNGVTFIVSPQSFAILYGDGRGENSPDFRRGKSASIPNIAGRWVNLTAIIRGATDMDLYLNGINVGGQYSGSSDFPMSSMSPGDDAKIGFWLSNGITTHFKGLMDELRIFDRTLTATEVRQQMCSRLMGDEIGLIGYWAFDEVSGGSVKDTSPNHFDGQLKGSPTRVFSGAPIGDESVYMYTTNWSNKSLTLDGVTAQNITQNPEGIHVYKVLNMPTQHNGLDLSLTDNFYYGVFVASTHVGSTFELASGAAALCSALDRHDNSVAQWIELKVSTGIPDRIEVIRSKETALEVSLGPDREICDQPSYILTTNIADLSGSSILWSSGETSPSIMVTQSGTYGVKVSSSCSESLDTVKIELLKKPLPFDLGEDYIICTAGSRLLKPYASTVDGEFEWQDGSTGDSFLVDDSGTYWVTVKSACGVESDTIHVVKSGFLVEAIPNIITPNDDLLNQYFVLQQEKNESAQLVVYNRWGEEVFRSADYQNDWDGSQLPSGIYFYQLFNECLGEKRGTVTISR